MARVRPGAGASTFPPGRNYVIAVFMAEQETPITKKRRGPKPTGLGTLVGVRLQPHDLAALDAAMAEIPAETRPEALRIILREWLAGRGRQSV